MAPALRGIDGATLLAALLESLRFFAYPDSAPALEALRAAGIRAVVVSNWDWSLHERLQETGLAPLLDGALASAEVGVAKPDREIFELLLERFALDPAATLFVDDVHANVAAAASLGLDTVLFRDPAQLRRELAARGLVRTPA
jgi:HAD superfamily hydrolase (TIGR01509 family)